MTFFSIGFVTIEDIFFLKANLTTCLIEFNILSTFFIDEDQFKILYSDLVLFYKLANNY